MATEDERPGLLSKMALFVRNPTKDWSELDSPLQRGEPGYDKHTLQAMIERKRQNDFVRRREFDQLRKLRNRNLEVLGNAEHLSNFQNSVPADQDESTVAVTLRKIDEIEAQMSKQWWRNKHEAGGAQERQVVMPPMEVGFTPATGFALTATSMLATMRQSQYFDATQTFAVTRAPDTQLASEFMPTHLSDVVHKSASAARDTPPAKGAGAPGGTAQADVPVVYPCSADVAEMLGDPELEEAAIRFANDDVTGAEQLLLDALRGAPVVPARALSWVAALLDLYRATNRQSDFDAAVREFSGPLADAKPVWFDLGVGMPGADGVSMGAGAHWDCSAELGLTDMLRLQEMMANHSMPWSLNWSPLQSFAPDVLAYLLQLFDSWCAEPVQASFFGAEQLLHVLRCATPSAGPPVDAGWWLVRMAALRALGLQADYERVAHDYGVCFAGAPPPWQAAQCTLVWQAIDAASSVLRGEVLGDATQALNGWLGVSSDGAVLKVGCGALLRVDFAAAGSILNWVTQREAQGCSVQFHHVHRLVAAFFNVIGINEYATVIPRAV